MPERLVELDGDFDPENLERRPAARMPGRGSLELSFEADGHQATLSGLHRDASAQLRQERERGEDEEAVEGEVSLDAEPGRVRLELQARTELHGVRRQREVRVELQPRVVAVPQADA